MEDNLADFAKRQLQANQAVNTNRAANNGGGEGAEPPEIDDLTEIVGIGRVFPRLLNELGVYSFRQIAAFGPAEIALVNRELKEFKGQMERDDWIGQSRELHFRKYGNTGKP